MPDTSNSSWWCQVTDNLTMISSIVFTQMNMGINTRVTMDTHTVYSKLLNMTTSATMNCLLWIRDPEKRKKVGVRIKYSSHPVTEDNLSRSLYHDPSTMRMEVGAKCATISDSVADIISVETDVEPCSMMGKPVYLALFIDAKTDSMEWKEDGQNISKYVEITNMCLERMRMEVLVIKTNIDMFVMTRSEVLSTVMNVEIKWWLELLDYMTRSKGGMNLGMEVNYMRLMGDFMEREMMWTRGTSIQTHFPTERFAFKTLKEVVGALARTWFNRLTMTEIWKMYSMYTWDTMRMLSSFDRGARLVSAVLWKVSNMKTIIFEETRVIFYMEEEPVMWPETHMNWIGRH